MDDWLYKYGLWIDMVILVFGIMMMFYGMRLRNEEKQEAKIQKIKLCGMYQDAQARDNCIIQALTD